MGPKYYTLNDVYTAAKYDSNFDYCFWFQIILSILARFIFLCLGRSLVCLASFLILSIGISGFLIVLPVIAEPWTLWFNFNITWGLFILSSIIFNYISAVITDPGSPSAAHDKNDRNLISRHLQLNFDEPQCKKCQLPKPERTHHCSICKRCVHKMDHHCPWINNCVGLNNYRYFYSFLLWTCFGTFYLSALLTPVVLREGSIIRIGEESYYQSLDKHEMHKNYNLRGKKERYTPKDIHDHSKAIEEPTFDSENMDKLKIVSSRRSLENSKYRMPASVLRSGSGPGYSFADVLYIHFEWILKALQEIRESEMALTLIFILSAAISFAVGLILSLHTYLVTSGQTTIEYFKSFPLRAKFKKAGRSYLNPYNRGWRLNVEQIFGHGPCYLWFICSRKDPLPAVPIIRGNTAPDFALSRC